MESNKATRNLQQAFVQQKYIVGDRPGRYEFIGPDLNIRINDDDMEIKDEPENPEDELIVLYDDDEIKEEPCSPENKTEDGDSMEAPEYECPVGSSNNDNSDSYIIGSVHPNDIDTVQSLSTSSSTAISKHSTAANSNKPINAVTFKDVQQDERQTAVQQDETQTAVQQGVMRTAVQKDVLSITGGNSETILLSDIQQQLAESTVVQQNFGSLNQDVHIVALISGPPPRLEEQDLEEEVQVQVSNKWIESRGDTYVNLSILSGFPNPQVTKSISLTREGIQIFIHKLPLKTSHSIWNILGSSTAIEKGQSLSTIANLVEKMKICTGCWDQKCRDIWEEGVFGERGFVESGFSPSPVYRTFTCHLLIDSESRCDACNECRSEWTNMIRVINKKRRKINEVRDLDKINYKFLTKADMENALRETRKEASKYRKQITMLHQEIDGLLGAERGRRNRFRNDEIIIINDKFT